MSAYVPLYNFTRRGILTGHAKSFCAPVLSSPNPSGIAAICGKTVGKWGGTVALS
ncbi:MAG: hypothetical protein ACI9AQ_001715 [Dinoroseobacter sp.]